MNSPLPEKKTWLAGICGLLVLVMLVASLGTHCQPDVDVELAKTARTAVEMAQEAQRNNDAAYLWPGRLRIIAIVIGVSVPVAVAGLLVYLMTRHRSDDLDVLIEAYRQRKRLDQDGRSIGRLTARPARHQDIAEHSRDPPS
jgi:hypothetical protein